MTKDAPQDGPLLHLSDLPRAPEFHLDQLLDVLSRTPDGFRTQRTQITLDEGHVEPGWTAGTYGDDVGILPDYACGFHELGDGKVLTVIAGRAQDRAVSLSLNTGSTKRSTWKAAVTVEAVQGQWPSPDRAASHGEGEAADPGVAALIAYLRAWGTLA